MEDIAAADIFLSSWWVDFSGPIFLHSSLFESRIKILASLTLTEKQWHQDFINMFGFVCFFVCLFIVFCFVFQLTEVLVWLQNGTFRLMTALHEII